MASVEDDIKPALTATVPREHRHQHFAWCRFSRLLFWATLDWDGLISKCVYIIQSTVYISLYYKKITDPRYWSCHEAAQNLMYTNSEIFFPKGYGSWHQRTPLWLLTSEFALLCSSSYGREFFTAKIMAVVQQRKDSLKGIFGRGNLRLY